MELNLVPLIEAAKGLTWQGAIVLIVAMGITCLMSWVRLLHGREERAFWREASPDQIQARASTTATLPPPTKAPQLPIVPLAIMLLLGACTLGAGSAGARRILPERILCGERISAAIDYSPDVRAPALPIYAAGGR